MSTAIIEDIIARAIRFSRIPLTKAKIWFRQCWEINRMNKKSRLIVSWYICFYQNNAWEMSHYLIIYLHNTYELHWKTLKEHNTTIHNTVKNFVTFQFEFHIAKKVDMNYIHEGPIVLCIHKPYSCITFNLGFVKHYTVVKLYLIDINTLLSTQEQLCHDIKSKIGSLIQNFISISHRFTWIINLIIQYLF